MIGFTYVFCEYPVALLEGPIKLSISSSKLFICGSFFFMPVTIAGTELLFMGLTAPPTETGAGGAFIKSRKVGFGC